MKIKAPLISLAVITIISLFTACKKYPEGGYEKDGPKNIIYNWKLTLYEVDGIDSTDLINYNGNEDYKNVRFFPDASDPKNNKKVVAQPYNGNLCKMTFVSNNEALDGIVYSYGGALNCGISPTFCTKQIFTPETNTASWKILKLDSKELHLQSQQIHSYNLKFTRTN